MSAQVASNALKLESLDVMVAAGGTLEATTLILFANDPGVINPALGMGQFTEPTFTGYAAAAAIVFGSAFKDSDGKYKVTAPSKTFERTGGAVSDTIYGWALTDAAKTEFRGAKLLDEPVVLAAAGDGLTVQPEFSWGS